MAKTYTQIQAQIQKLQKEAEALRAKEIAAVVARIQEAIDHYKLTPADLFGKVAAKSAPGQRKPAAGRKAAAKASKKKTALPPKYADGQGNTWSGVGKRPNWLRAALEAGKTLAELQIQQGG